MANGYCQTTVNIHIPILIITFLASHCSTWIELLRSQLFPSNYDHRYSQFYFYWQPIVLWRIASWSFMEVGLKCISYFQKRIIYIRQYSDALPINFWASLQNIRIVGVHWWLSRFGWGREVMARFLLLSLEKSHFLLMKIEVMRVLFDERTWKNLRGFQYFQSFVASIINYHRIYVQKI